MLSPDDITTPSIPTDVLWRRCRMPVENVMDTKQPSYHSLEYKFSWAAALLGLAAAFVIGTLFKDYVRIHDIGMAIATAVLAAGIVSVTQLTISIWQYEKTHIRFDSQRPWKIVRAITPQDLEGSIAEDLQSRDILCDWVSEHRSQT